MNINRILVSVISIYSLSLSVSANDNQLIFQGRECAKLIENRLARLACFDDAFDTQLPDIKPEQGNNLNQVVQDLRPEFWHRVIAQEKKRENQDVFLSNLSTEKLNLNARNKQEGSLVQRDIIISQLASGALPPRPILVFSCIDNITRLQLLLHKPIEEGMTPLSLEIDAEVIASRWFSESNGYLIRAGRGLPGIQDIRSMFDKKILVIRSKETAIDGLSFELSSLRESIKPLRSACHW